MNKIHPYKTSLGIKNMGHLFSVDEPRDIRGGRGHARGAIDLQLIPHAVDGLAECDLGVLLLTL